MGANASIEINLTPYNWFKILLQNIFLKSLLIKEIQKTQNQNPKKNTKSSGTCLEQSFLSSQNKSYDTKVSNVALDCLRHYSAFRVG